MNDIEMAQVEAGENAVVERLRRKGLMPPVELRIDADQGVRQRIELEHSLATGFIKLQKERDPSRRAELWSGLLRLAAQIEKLNEVDQ